MIRYFMFFTTLALAGALNAQTVLGFTLSPQPAKLTLDLGDDITLHPNEWVTLGSDAIITGGITTSYYRYSWYHEGVRISTEVTNTVDYSQLTDTTYFVCSIYDLNCSTRDTVYVYPSDNTGLENMAGSSRLVLYPNPAGDYFRINPGNNFQVDRVEILSLSGKCIYSRRVNASDIQNQRFSVPAMPGAYLVRLSGGTISRTYQLIVSE